MKRTSRKTLLLLALAALFASGPSRAVDSGLMADPAVQSEIARAVETLNTASGAADRRQALQDARGLAGPDPEERTHLLEQLEIYLAGAVGTEQAMGGAVLLHALQFDREEIMAATLPHLVAADPALNKVLGEVAATAIEAGREDDPIALVLEAERLRLGEGDDGATPDGRAERLEGLLSLLAQDGSFWVRQYAIAAAASPGMSEGSPRP
jgi:hypothetical protein